MTVWTDVPEADVQQVKPGMPVYFTTLGVNNHRWTSKVRQILPYAIQYIWTMWQCVHHRHHASHQ